MSTFVFDHALSNIFCFPFWMYPLSFIPVCIIHYKLLYWHKQFKYKKDEYYMNEIRNLDLDCQAKQLGFQYEYKPFIGCNNNQLIMTHFMVYTPLSYDIIYLLIDEFCYDKKYEKYMQYKDKKWKYKLFKDSFDCYQILTFLFHVLSFIVILFINIEWIMENNYSFWTFIQSICLNVFALHPASKLLNLVWILSLRFKINNFRYYSWQLIPAFMTVTIIVDIASFFIYILPSFTYYILFWIVIIVISVVFVIITKKRYNTIINRYCTFTIIMMLSWIYIIGICMIYSMCCVYSQQITLDKQYNLCLYQALKSSYCPNSSVLIMDWSDWRAYIMLIAWFFF